MKSQRDALDEPRRRARRLSRAAKALADQLVDVRRAEEAQAAASPTPPPTTAAATQRASASPAEVTGEPQAKRAKHRPMRALLIINTKSGPNNDSILHVREVVERLAAHGIEATVRVKLRKKLARRDAKTAAKKGYPLVIAAGGDGTITAVAEGLVGTKAILGIIPLGTYNNVATCLGIPTELDAACALVASGLVRAVDVGRVAAKGANRKRVFMETAAVGVTAAMMPVGQDFKEGRLQEAAAQLPAALKLTPTQAAVRLDATPTPNTATTLLIEVVNAPRSGPGVITTPEARLDDGLLDVAIYHEVGQAALAARFVALKTGVATDDARIERVRARRVDVRTTEPLPVVADAKVVGTTPARFEVLAGALLVVAGHGIGLATAPRPSVVAASTRPAPAVPDEGPDEGERAAQAAAQPGSPATPLAAAAATLSGAVEFVRDTILPARGADPAQGVAVADGSTSGDRQPESDGSDR